MGSNKSHPVERMVTDRAAEIRARMAQIRGNLADHAHTVAVEAHRSTDWRLYVARHPWVWAAGAAAVGYLLIPRRPKVVVDSKTMERVIQEAAEKVGLQKSEPTKKAALFGLAMGVIQAAALQGARVFLESKLRNMNSPVTDEVEAVQHPNRPR